MPLWGWSDSIVTLIARLHDPIGGYYQWLVQCASIDLVFVGHDDIFGEMGIYGTGLPKLTPHFPWGYAVDPDH